MSAQIDELKSQISVVDFFDKFIEDFNPSEPLQLCPFEHTDDHDKVYTESNPSLSVDTKRGMFNCFACGRKGGDIIDFYGKLSGNGDKPFPDLLNSLAKEFGIEFTAKPTVPTEAIEKWHRALLGTKDKLKFLTNERGLQISTIKEFQLGWDGKRFTIPIPDAAGDFVNCRCYNPGSQKNKMINYSDGSDVSFGRSRLFPYTNLDNDTIIICEGELDALVLHQNGYPVVTNTAGATTWRVKWNNLFHDKTVFICYDNDSAGLRGSKQVAESLAPFAKEIFIVSIPLDEKGADVTDWFVVHGRSAEEFDALLENATLYTANETGTKPQPTTDETPLELTLAEASQAEYNGRVIRIRARVAGKNLAPYQVPCRVRFRCDQSYGDPCLTCKVSKDSGDSTLEIPWDDGDLLKFTNVNDAQLRGVLKAKRGIPQRCTRVRLENLAMVNIEEIRLIPDVDFTDNQSTYVVRQAYMVGEPIELNRVFIFTGQTLPDPRTQAITHLFHELKPAQSSLERFELTPDMEKSFKALRPKSNSLENISRKVDEICMDLETVTKIVGRRDIHIAVLLTYFSPIGFIFQKIEQRGWLDTLIIGDTRTGKTQVVGSLLNHFRAGEMTAGENCTIAGLLAGLQQVNRQWILMWGAFPLNDCGLYVVDEASGLKPEDIAKLSSVRSSGVAQVTKVHTERTTARTRKIWIANPRAQHEMERYNYGVIAVKDLFGQLEDVARTDLVVAVQSAEVETLNIHNQVGQLREISSIKFTTEIMHDAILWAWKLKPESVTFTKAATELTLQLALEQGKRYVPSIPLVERAEQRVKIARVAAAIAALTISTPDMKSLVVEEGHVQYAVEFLESLYAKDSLGYLQFSERELKKTQLENPELLLPIITKELRELFRDTDQITQHMMKDILGIDSMNEIARVMQTLLRCNALARTGTSFYTKTPAFIKWLNDSGNWKTKSTAKAKTQAKATAKRKRKF